MTQDTRAFRWVKIVYYGIALLVAGCIEFLSTRLAPTDPFKDLLHDAAIATVLAVAGVFATSLTRRLLDSHAKEVGNRKKLTELWEQLGIENLVAEWKELLVPTGAGHNFRSQLREYFQDSVWYVVTINPQGFSGEFFDNVILPALQRGVRIKWSYVRLPHRNDANGRALRAWWASQYVCTSDFEKSLDFAERNLANYVNQVTLHVQQKVEEGKIQLGSLEVYESIVPTTFLALLAVKHLHDVSGPATNSKEWVKRNNGIVLVDPYIMFPVTGQQHWGMLLASPGELYQQYASSIVRFFDVGVSAGYLCRIYPGQETNGTA